MMMTNSPCVCVVRDAESQVNRRSTAQCDLGRIYLGAACLATDRQPANG